MDIREEIRRGVEKKESWSKRIVVNERTVTRVRVRGGSLSITTTSRYGRIVRSNIITDWYEVRWTSAHRIEHLYQILHIDIFLRLLDVNPSIVRSFHKSEKVGAMMCCIVGRHCFYTKSSDHPFHAVPIVDDTIRLPPIIISTIGKQSITRYNGMRVEAETMDISPSFSDIDLLLYL